MFISLGNGTSWLQTFPSLKYYNVQKWESGFSSGLDVAKNTHYMRKCFKYLKQFLQKWESRFSLGLDASKNSHYIRKRFK